MTPSEPLRLRALISGGHSGVQRAALDVALELDIPHGGICPEGRVADDGVLPPRYRLRPAKDRNHYKLAVRNVKVSDGTLIVTRGAVDMMARYVTGVCSKLGKPWLACSPEALTTELVTRWLREHQIEVLHVHGPREAGVQKPQKNRVYQPGIGEEVRAALRVLLTRELEVVRGNVLAHARTLKAESDQAPTSAVPASTAPARPRDPEPHGPPLAPRL